MLKEIGESRTEDELVIKERTDESLERETIRDVGASSFNSTVLMNALRSDQVESARFPPPM